ncbi:hypothetical protein BpHYR1_008544 [Brachionus plicatilis]|uniref:Uncharacterized protein n=1 Tax=Brachionus plicatilis TaxID=10195 RepID=A0A3M7T4W5_BRAPC|nr:hypothetical protein BpHYR1_008544 [Brachionus plicatilis]
MVIYMLIIPFLTGRGLISTEVRRKPKYDVNFWSKHRRLADYLPRTTIGVESWHNSFANTLRSHPVSKNENRIREAL